MKIVISDYPDVLGRELEKEIAFVREDIPDAAVVVHPYAAPEDFYREMADADGLLTAFIPLDRAALDRMPQLKAVAINATGYNFVDLEETRRRSIPVCAIGEYCTQEVADHTMALLLALDRNLKHYSNDIDHVHRWQYYSAPRPMGLDGKTLGLFGFGKIGKAVARRARGFGMRVLAVDPRAAGLDVLEAEKPDLAHCALTGRENVIITSHAAFYSARAIDALQRMSCKNLTACLTGHPEQAFRVVNGVGGC